MEVRNIIKVETSQGRHERNILGPMSVEKGVMFYDVRIHFNEKDIKDIQNEALPEVLDTLFQWRTFKIWERMIIRKSGDELNEIKERVIAKFRNKSIAEHHYNQLIGMIDGKIDGKLGVAPELVKLHVKPDGTMLNNEFGPDEIPF